MTDNDLKTLLHPVQNLPANAKPAWGQMSAQHMIEHLLQTLRLSNGKIRGQCAYDEKRQAVLRRFLRSDKPMPRDFTNPLVGPELKPLQFSDIEEAKKALNAELADFHDYFGKNPDATPVNPTFGPLTYEEWIMFHRKHMTHHLTQFKQMEQ